MVCARTLNPLHALLLGLVEGLTEYLPVSSTGHLLLVCNWLGIEKTRADTFSIVIQAGAILAVLVHYRALFARHLRGLVTRDPASYRLLLALIVGCVPTIAIALVFGKAIKKYLFGNLPISIGLLVGGVVMIAVDRLRRRSAAREGLETITRRDAAIVGAAQVAALWPGTSRSLATIVGGQLAGLSARTAADFAFLLGLPTLGGACLYEGYKEHETLAQIGALPIAIGMVTSFLVAWLVIAAFLRYLQRGSLVPFGIYRLLLGAGVLAYELIVR